MRAWGSETKTGLHGFRVLGLEAHFRADVLPTQETSFPPASWRRSASSWRPRPRRRNGRSASSPRRRSHPSPETATPVPGRASSLRRNTRRYSALRGLDNCRRGSKRPGPDGRAIRGECQLLGPSRRSRRRAVFRQRQLCGAALNSHIRPIAAGRGQCRVADCRRCSRPPCGRTAMKSPILFVCSL